MAGVALTKSTNMTIINPLEQPEVTTEVVEEVEVVSAGKADQVRGLREKISLRRLEFAVDSKIMNETILCSLF